MSVTVDPDRATVAVLVGSADYVSWSNFMYCHLVNKGLWALVQGRRKNPYPGQWIYKADIYYIPHAELEMIYRNPMDDPSGLESLDPDAASIAFAMFEQGDAELKKVATIIDTYDWYQDSHKARSIIFSALSRPVQANVKFILNPEIMWIELKRIYCKDF